MSADEFERQSDTRGFELVNGVVQELHMDQLAAWVAGEIHRRFSNHVTDRKLGWVYPSDAAYKCFDSVNFRRADVSFVSIARQPDGPRPGVMTVAPDLVVEVVSRYDVYTQLRQKVQLYLDAGVRAVWVVDVEYRDIFVYRPAAKILVFAADESIDAGDVLPGFSVRVADFFPVRE